MINGLFDQFSPDLITIIPIQSVAAILSITWFIAIFPTNYFSGNINYIWENTRTIILNLIFQNTSEKSAPWISPLSAIFFTLLSINLLGLLPYSFTITSHISFTYSIAIPLWLSVNILGFFLAFNTRLSHLVPQGTPSPLIPLMVWIESISLLAQPIALGLRLAANLTAGHLLLFLLSITTWTLSSNIITWSLLSLVLVLIFILEFAVACIQAYVFTSLISFFLDQNI